MKPKFKPNQGITVHRDHTVSFFSVYLQQWRRTSLASLGNNHDDFAALTEADRRRINNAFRKLLT